MTDVNSTTSDDTLEALRTRADALERQLQEVESNAITRLRDFELKTEALRAGILDLDGLRLLEPKQLSGNTANFSSPSEVVSQLRQERPWLFGSPSSSSLASTPAAVPAKRKLATEMTVDEWRAARSDLLRRK